MKLPITEPLIEFLIALIPGKKIILKFWARLHPIAKKILPTRVAASISRRIPGVSLSTNLGISPAIKVRFQSNSVYSALLFGVLDSYKGERGSLRLCKALASKYDFFFDIGANHGMYTFYVASFFKKPIFSFEPNPQLFSEIKENLSLTPFSHVTLVPTAISSSNGKNTFFINRSSDLSSTLKPELFSLHTFEETSIQTTTLDSFIEKLGNPSLPTLPLIKVDVEGAEEDFIKGAEQTLSRNCILILELIGKTLQEGLHLRIQEQFKFNTYYIRDTTLCFLPTATFDFHAGEYNWLFCRLGPEELSILVRPHGISVIT